MNIFQLNHTPQGQFYQSAPDNTPSLSMPWSLDAAPCAGATYQELTGLFDLFVARFRGGVVPVNHGTQRSAVHRVSHDFVLQINSNSSFYIASKTDSAPLSKTFVKKWIRRLILIVKNATLTYRNSIRASMKRFPTQTL